MENDEIYTSFSSRYSTAIVLVAILSTVSFFALFIGLNATHSTASIVNISGKQRMLSQQITSLSQQYYHTVFGIEKASNKNQRQLQSDLKDAINQMRFNNDALSSGQIGSTKLSGPIRELYFGNTNLKKRVNAYLELSEKLLQSKSKSDASLVLHQIISLSDNLLPPLIDSVLLYQVEGENNINTIRYIVSIAWILILFILILELLFIYQPMVVKLKELFRKIAWERQGLEQKIELRTLSLEQANLKLLHMASHDPLTGLKNRLNLEKELETLLVHHKNNHIPFAVAMIDIDYFKKINDTYGHDVGDFVLCELGRILKESVREQDSVYRAGGEEFVILFNRINKEQALAKVEKIRLNLQKHLFDFNECTFNITLSGGLYHPDVMEAKTVQEIMKAADLALYQAKHSGRNQIVLAQEAQESS